MTQGQYASLKKALDRNRSLTRTSATRPGVKTITYTDKHGMSFQLRFRTKSAGFRPFLSVGGCGFLQLCVYFNHTDQGAIAAGTAAGLAALICLEATPAGCAVAAAVVTTAAFYIAAHGICSKKRRLQVELLPFTGSNKKCVS